MKHLRYFESKKNLDVKVGDYFLLLDNVDYKWNVDLDVKILRLVDRNNKEINSLKGELCSCKIEAFKKNGNLVEFWVYNDDLERKLTPEEIDEYEVKKQALNYNL